MTTSKLPYTFSQMQIDAARNSTDDFNLFHDSKKWDRIKHNPFGGPIILGFQLECLIEKAMRDYRIRHDEIATITEKQLRYSHYQFSFANAVKPDEPVGIEIKKTRLKYGENPAVNNRVTIRSKNGISLSGYKKESRYPLHSADFQAINLGDLNTIPDRSFLDNNSYFLKRKFLTTSNAKNFLLGSNVDQTLYFDELENKVVFPEVFPVSLISCALLERGLKDGHDFESIPMVYTNHHISVDTHQMQTLRSNDTLHILVKKPEIIIKTNAANGVEISNHAYQCLGIVNTGIILFSASISLMPLADILKTFSARLG